MKQITIEVPDGKKAEWIDGVLKLVDEKDNRPVTERIKTFEDCLDELGEDHPLVKEYRSIVNVDVDFKVDLIAYLKLRIICAVLNEGWEPKFTTDEYRYYPWFEFFTQEEIDEMDEDKKGRVLGRSDSSALALAGVACSYADYASSYSLTSNGARLCFFNRELAEYAGKQFLEDWANFVFRPENLGD